MLSIRPARGSDVDTYYTWVNQDSVRENAFSKEKIGYSDHCRWFTEKLRSPSTFLYMAELNGQPVGQIRYDKKVAEEAYVVDFHVGSDFTGRGIGCLMLTESINSLDRECGNCVQIEAVVFKRNLASMKCFEKALFYAKEVFLREGEWCVLYRRVRDE